ncbi:hypothetical protein J2736_004904 [Paenibacillus qinlingensis]|uniref:Uncharacterized protein n=1 Tax=Paenibacillus qinlingensis TaxID=1837343 RepID=A0ABU1P3A4_9BACL|nr:hypothetical protein [Paenibacillus qinlingensis]
MQIVAYYIADNGELVKVTNSYFDTATGTLIFKVSHFSQSRPLHRLPVLILP